MKKVYKYNPEHYNEIQRHRLPSPTSKSGARSTRNCASLRCDVDAKISCGGKTFETKHFRNISEREPRRKIHK